MKAILVFIVWFVGLYAIDLNQETNQKHNFILGFIGFTCAVIIPIMFFASFC